MHASYFFFFENRVLNPPPSPAEPYGRALHVSIPVVRSHMCSRDAGRLPIPVPSRQACTSRHALPYLASLSLPRLAASGPTRPRRGHRCTRRSSSGRRGPAPRAPTILPPALTSLAVGEKHRWVKFSGTILRNSTFFT